MAHVSQTAPSVPADAKRPRARRGPRKIPFGYVLILPIVIYEGIFLLYPMYRGLELGLEKPDGGYGLHNFDRLIHD